MADPPWQPHLTADGPSWPINDSAITRLDLEATDLQPTVFATNQEPNALATAPDGTFALLGFAGGGVHLLSLPDCKVQHSFPVGGDIVGLAIGPESGRITVTGNNFSDRYIGDGKFRSNRDQDRATGVFLFGTTDVAVAGNVFAGLNRQAIEADAACRRINILGNVITDLNRRTDTPRPALDLADGRHVLVEHNTLPDQPPK